MRVFNEVVFDDVVASVYTAIAPTTKYFFSNPRLCALIGLVEQVVITVTVDQIYSTLGTGWTASLTVQQYHSGDERYFNATQGSASVPAQIVKKTNTPEATVALADGGTTYVVVGTDDGTTPSAAFVGLVILLAPTTGSSPPGNTLSVHVKVTVTGRVAGDFDASACGCGPEVGTKVVVPAAGRLAVPSIAPIRPPPRGRA